MKHVILALLTCFQVTQPVRLPEQRTTTKEVTWSLFSAIKKTLISDVIGTLKNGAQVDATDSDGNTPLHLSVQKNLIITRHVLSHNASVLHKKNNYDETPLILAAKSNKAPIVMYLLRKSLFSSEDLNRALYWALINKNLSMSIQLIDCGGRIMPTRFSKKDPLAVARSSAARDYICAILNYENNGIVKIMSHIKLGVSGWLNYFVTRQDLWGIYRLWSKISCSARVHDFSIEHMTIKNNIIKKALASNNCSLIREFIVGLGCSLYDLSFSSIRYSFPLTPKDIKNLFVLAHNADKCLDYQQNQRFTDIIFLFK